MVTIQVAFKGYNFSSFRGKIAYKFDKIFKSDLKKTIDFQYIFIPIGFTTVSSKLYMHFKF